MRISRLALIVSSASLVGACGFLPPSQQQQIALTGAPPTQTAGIFRNADPNINDTLAQQACVEGYEKLGGQALPTDLGTIEEWQIRCAPHSAWSWLAF
ncbi:MAG: hypothetical protein WDN69_01795 [Aliidongia sp.]